MCGDLHARFVARDIDCEDRNSRCVRLLNDGDDRLRIARTEHNRADLFDDEVFDLIALLGNVFVTADHDCFVAEFFSLGGDTVADDLEERIVER